MMEFFKFLLCFLVVTGLALLGSLVIGTWIASVIEKNGEEKLTAQYKAYVVLFLLMCVVAGCAISVLVMLYR